MKSIAIFLLLATVGYGTDVQSAGKIQMSLWEAGQHLLNYGIHTVLPPPKNAFYVGTDGKFNWTKLRRSLRWDADRSIRYYNRRVFGLSKKQKQFIDKWERHLHSRVVKADNRQEGNDGVIYFSLVSYYSGKITEISEASDYSSEEKVVAAIKAHQIAADLALIKNKLGAARKIMRRIIRVSESVDHRVQLQVDMQDRGTVFLNRDNLDDVVQYLHGEVQRVKSE